MLSVGEREALEAERARRGLRSEADVIRAWIAEIAVPNKALVTAALRGVQALSKDYEEITRHSAPFKTRLKGDWKAP